MSIKSLAFEGLLSVVAELNPEYAPAISWIKAHEDDLDKIVTLADAAVREGGSAMEAVDKAAPDLSRAIRDMVNESAPTPDDSGVGASRIRHERATRAVLGLPRMTPAQEAAWMNGATAHLEDSRSGA